MRCQKKKHFRNALITLQNYSDLREILKRQNF